MGSGSNQNPSQNPSSQPSTQSPNKRKRINDESRQQQQTQYTPTSQQQSSSNLFASDPKLQSHYASLAQGFRSNSGVPSSLQPTMGDAVPQPVNAAPTSSNANGSPSAGDGDAPNRPPVGSEEWHRQRRDNHKEVERRRRETINDGINQLAKIIPASEKNKGSILAKAVNYINQLKQNESQYIEKWTLEKLFMEQGMEELRKTNEQLKMNLEKAWRECEAWKKVAQSHGDDSNRS